MCFQEMPGRTGHRTSNSVFVNGIDMFIDSCMEGSYCTANILLMAYSTQYRVYHMSGTAIEKGFDILGTIGRI